MNIPSQATLTPKATCLRVPPFRLPEVPIKLGHLRLGWRWSRYLLWSVAHAHPYGVKTAGVSLAQLGFLSAHDVLLRHEKVECNICGWQGARFYPNTGSGYFELDSNCPRCSCIHRYRSLQAVLELETDFFSPAKSVIEVAPVRSFQAYCLWRKSGQNYISFDLEKFGMEKGDLTAMRYADSSCDYFLCFHVLEHVPKDTMALKEIFRVLRPGGLAILQVPIDWSLADTIEYGRANPLETGHVRRYSEIGFASRIKDAGFAVRKVCSQDLFSAADIRRFGLNVEPLFFATKPV